MFIIINFGYRSRKIFTIDCLAAALFDCIWQACYKQLSELYGNRDGTFIKEIGNHQKKIQKDQKRLETVIVKLKEQQQNNPDKKKDDKKGAKKGGKDAPVQASSPLEQQKIDLQKGLEFSKNAIVKYNQKINKIKQLQNKLEDLKNRILKEQLYIELVDKTGQRKFIKTKLKNMANQFLSDRGTYYLCTVQQGQDQQEVEPVVHEGFPVRTVEQDSTIVGQQAIFSIKKQDKGKKGGKKK